MPVTHCIHSHIQPHLLCALPRYPSPTCWWRARPITKLLYSYWTDGWGIRCGYWTVMWWWAPGWVYSSAQPPSTTPACHPSFMQQQRSALVPAPSTHLWRTVPRTPVLCSLLPRRDILPQFMPEFCMPTPDFDCRQQPGVPAIPAATCRRTTTKRHPLTAGRLVRCCRFCNAPVTPLPYGDDVILLTRVLSFAKATLCERGRTGPGVYSDLQLTNDDRRTGFIQFRRAFYCRTNICHWFGDSDGPP